MATATATKEDSTTHLLSTRNTIADETRTTVIKTTNNAIASLIDLQLQTKQTHWNLRAPQFIAIHEMLDEFYADLDKYVDILAERITQLGGAAYGTLEAVTAATTLTKYPSRIHTWDSRVKHLAEVIAISGTQCREAIDTTDEAGDAVTADIYTQTSRGLDMWLWKVESHLDSN
ncbi:MAG: DNA starvation/stationary phase protection protein Dps [Fimbriimonadaceae bacterium]